MGEDNKLFGGTFLWDNFNLKLDRARLLADKYSQKTRKMSYIGEEIKGIEFELQRESKQ